jgi:LuxR family maltose regulon positive regulatory protein
MLLQYMGICGPGSLLLKTRFLIPHTRQALIQRPALAARLQAGSEGRLTLVSAPAGFGKTTLLAAWAAEAPLPVAWLSLEASDGDPRRFLLDIAAALNVAGVLDEENLARLQAAEVPPRTLLTVLLGELEAVERPFALVLDDYHALQTQVPPAGLLASQEGGLLATLLESLPPQARLLIATRLDPPLPLARLRARGELTELRAADLRFNSEEAAAFLGQVMNLALRAQDVSELERRTEGWAAGLQLAGLAMQRIPDQPGLQAFIRAFSGSHRFILDYLVEEVLASQPPDMQRFLLQTAVLERFCADLCQAVVSVGTLEGPNVEMFEGANALSFQGILEYLEHANLFLVPLDDERRWYRYHHLFADLLRARLMQRHPERLPELRRRAAHWHEHNGTITEAVQYVLAAGDFELAAGWIERHGQERWAASDPIFLNLANRLPAAMLAKRPLLGIYRAWTLIIQGEARAAENLLLALVGNLPGAELAEQRGLHSFIDLLLAYTADLTGRPATGKLPDPRRLEEVPAYLLGMRNSADVVLALLLSARGSFDAVEAILDETLRRDMAANGTTAVPISASLLARNRAIQGRLHAAADLCRQYLQWIEGRGAWRFYLPGNLNAALGEVLREWGQLDEAEVQLRQGLERNQAWDLPLGLANGYTALARLQRTRGELDAAQETIARVEQLLVGRSLPLDFWNELELEKVRLWLQSGNLPAAQAWADAWTAQLPAAAAGDYRYELAQMTLARLHLAQGRSAEAHRLLGDLAGPAQAGGRNGRLIAIRLLDALALQALNRPALALGRLEESLALAAPQGYLSLFVECGAPAQKLLAAYQGWPSAAQRSYARRLLKVFGSSEAPPQPGLAEPLTARELEVLGLVCRGCSNKEIAGRLFISIGAVKKHTGNIYGKLGVSSRTQAVARARQLGLSGED